MPIRATNTFDEQLNKVLAQVAQLKTMPDADLDFCVQLETTILQKLREPDDMLAQAQAQKAGLPPPGGAPAGPPGMPPGMPGMPPDAGMPPGMPPGIPAGVGAGPGGIPPELLAAISAAGGAGGGGGGGGMPPLGMPPVPGTRVQPNMPNPDELRRLIQQGQ